MPAFDIREARINEGLSQRALALQCEVSLTVIQRLEAGGFATPANAKAVADHFEVQVTDIMAIPERRAS